MKFLDVLSVWHDSDSAGFHLAVALGALPEDAWLDRLTAFVATKRGFASALHSGDPAYDALPGFFHEKLGPALESLLDAAVAAGVIRAGVSARDLLFAVAKLCAPMPAEEPDYARRMVALLVDGLRSV